MFNLTLGALTLVRELMRVAMILLLCPAPAQLNVWPPEKSEWHVRDLRKMLYFGVKLDFTV